MRARLTVEGGLALPHLIELNETTIIRIGRHRDNDLVLQDRHASRYHCRLYCADGRWILVDQETTNGTRLDGQLIQSDTPIQQGQVIGIGEVRLRFHLEIPGDDDSTADEPHVVAAPVMDLSESTLFQPDELTALLRFMNSSLGESTPSRLVHLALECVLRQTTADLAGFLSFDAGPELRLVLPAQAPVDRHLSHRLTQQARQANRTVWLRAPDALPLQSESLSNFYDALCIPLRTRPGGVGDDIPLGALHAYKSNRPFGERQVRFCEILAGSLGPTLYQLRSRRALEADNSRLRVRASTAADELVGNSAAMTRLRQQIRQLAASSCTVLIFGESGVGKELVASGLHRQSSRESGPLVTVNCASIPPSLAESELFGHVKGAFSNALRNHPGYFAQADMGTLFLDELGELTPDMQARLLRAIETRSFRPVGATSDSRADVRIIAATNRDLDREVEAGRFRRDLLFRLTARINVPPLREHLDDVPELVQHFLEHLNREYHRNVVLADSALERLRSYAWPGNIRQLRSVLEAAVALAEDSTTLHASDLHLPDPNARTNSDGPPTINLEVLEQWAIRHALQRTEHNNTRAAELLGIHRDTLIKKLKKYGIHREDRL